jgi:hypothetical protein
MKQNQIVMRPQDVVVLLKIIALNGKKWGQTFLAEELEMSQAEISHSLTRSHYAGLIDYSGKIVLRNSLYEFIIHGLKFVFPQQPGAIVRGIPTAHSALPLSESIQSEEKFVWPSATGAVRGQSIIPLYPNLIKAVKKDEKLYELCALMDAIRVGKAREVELAKKELKERILDAK